MSDLLKKFKSVFIVEEEQTKQPSSANTPTPSATPAQAAPPPPPVVASASPSSESARGGQVNQRFIDILMTALEKNNQAGFDYFEFRQALLNLAKMPMDEQTRFQSAYAMAQTMGVSPSGLVESGKFYLSVLNNEQAKFNEAHAQQRTKLIGSREEEVKNLETGIQQKAEQIKELTRQMEESRRKSEQIRAEISESTIKIENTKSDFDATFVNVFTQIQDDLAKIQQYLK
jgi:hypothetical protein